MVLPAAWPARLGGGQELVLDTGEGKAWAQRVVGSGSGPAGRIFAEIEIGDLLRERRRILLVLIGSNAALTLGVPALVKAAVELAVQALGTAAAAARDGAETTRQFLQCLAERLGASASRRPDAPVDYRG